MSTACPRGHGPNLLRVPCAGCGATLAMLVCAGCVPEPRDMPAVYCEGCGRTMDGALAMVRCPRCEAPAAAFDVAQLGACPACHDAPAATPPEPVETLTMRRAAVTPLARPLHAARPR